ncbi:carbohydrate-binding domain-containing protein [Streptococcus chenjunshii]|uniref:Carbohydrate-binding domain-containing protein n=1 Tax=Streptococcus chenjunshii TaxID=2173853 RepID=A0A372KP48_9STRE|nr:carbohydrate-binding domain-containing protein [Streptococcus chenjunshii]AXQ78673.1 carbohydrate-binding domain-containing protein [Streptococcus chenjunshii]RFU51734.1 carbohydrate-binding domain-containing protein [Streptococcus chenjunshii]RFU54055.1 carbohydrate-binding domain-containing protein [Streptococcus chenjunshii]
MVKIQRKMLFLLCSLAALLIAACSSQNTNTSTSGSINSNSEVSTSTAVNSAYFIDEDTVTDYDKDAASTIKLTGDTASVSGEGVSIANSKVTISKAGTYLISGESENVQVQVAATESDNVRLVFNGVTMTGDQTAIDIQSAQRVFITLAEGTNNNIANSGSSDESEAVIYSETDLTFNGTGSLTVNGQYSNAIESEAGIHITGGSYNLTAVDDAVKVNNELNIANTTMTVEAGEDALKSDNDDNLTLGNLYLANSTLTISAGDDAVHASGDLLIDSGNIDIAKAAEGLEGKTVTINDGNFTINSSDDAINAANSNAAAEDIGLVINGGYFTITTSGDGLDSNNSIEIKGGTLYISAATDTANNALDYENEGIITGGQLIFLGSSEMAQGFSGNSTQASIMENIQGSGGSKIVISDSDGNELLSYTASQEFQNILVSTPELEEGQTYTITVDGQSITAKASLSTGQGGMMDSGEPGMGMP